MPENANRLHHLRQHLMMSGQAAPARGRLTRMAQWVVDRGEPWCDCGRPRHSLGDWAWCKGSPRHAYHAVGPGRRKTCPHCGAGTDFYFTAAGGRRG